MVLILEALHQSVQLFTADFTVAVVEILDQVAVLDLVVVVVVEQPWQSTVLLKPLPAVVVAVEGPANFQAE
jgi:hypothetical protein